jgi:hypothetical protein
MDQAVVQNSKTWYKLCWGVQVTEYHNASCRACIQVCRATFLYTIDAVVFLAASRVHARYGERIMGAGSV